jgi:hypothetical protein
MASGKMMKVLVDIQWLARREQEISSGRLQVAARAFVSQSVMFVSTEG